MANIVMLHTDNVVPLGHTSKDMHRVCIRLRGSALGRGPSVHRKPTAANLGYAPTGLDCAVTSDGGLALLSRIVGI